MRFYRPFLFQRIAFPGSLFRRKKAGRSILLTFDDGPAPESTDIICDILKRRGIKALFFCLGENAEKYPGLMARITADGHIIGNHGFRHLDGYVTGRKMYIENFEKGANQTSSKVFRPPYGRILPRQYRAISRETKIWFWDVMVYDFKGGISPSESLTLLPELVREGSVIVLHDQELSSAKVILDEVIDICESKGFDFGDPENPLWWSN